MNRLSVFKLLLSFVGALVTTCFLSYCSIGTAYSSTQKTTCPEGKNRFIYLTRHAEKLTDGTPNPSLSTVGIRRAKNLAQLLKTKNITLIYSTNYNRTMQTAKQVAEEIKIEITIYDPSNLKSIADKLFCINANILVIGHSNTTPALVELLGGQLQGDMLESDYGLVYQLDIIDSEVTTRLLYSSSEMPK